MPYGVKLWVQVFQDELPCNIGIVDLYSALLVNSGSIHGRGHFFLSRFAIYQFDTNYYSRMDSDADRQW